MSQLAWHNKAEMEVTEIILAKVSRLCQLSSLRISFFLCLCQYEKYNNLGLELERIKIGKQTFRKFGPFFGPFCKKSAKIRPKICPVALLFVQPFWAMRPNIRPVGNTGAGRNSVDDRLPEPIVIKQFHPKEGTEKVRNSCSINLPHFTYLQTFSSYPLFCSSMGSWEQAGKQSLKRV